MPDLTLVELRKAKADLEASLVRAIGGAFTTFYEKTGEYPKGLDVTVVAHRSMGNPKPDFILVTGVKVDLGRV